MATRRVPVLIVDGPNKYDLLIGGLVEGKTVGFTFDFPEVQRSYTGTIEGIQNAGNRAKWLLKGTIEVKTGNRVEFVDTLYDPRSRKGNAFFLLDESFKVHLCGHIIPTVCHRCPECGTDDHEDT